MISSTPEPEWDEDSRWWVLGLEAYKATLCPLCKRPLKVCTAPENEHAFAADEAPTRCHATTARSRAEKAKNANGKVHSYPHPEALMRSVTFNPARVIERRSN